MSSMRPTPQERRFYHFPETKSFIVGISGGCGITALFAGQADWWVWLIISFVVAIIASAQAVHHSEKMRRQK